MKKQLLALSVFACALHSQAQQTITGTTAVGYSVTFAAATPATASTVPVSTTGANVTWNCSGLATANQVFTLNISNPSNQPYFSDYPSSNWNLNASVSTMTLVNDFFILTADSLVKLGGHVAGNSYEIYNNPQLEFKFPFNFNDVVINTYAKTSYNANGSVSSTQTGSVTLSYEGYGTLILPVGTFTNVAMLKRVRTNSIGPTTTSYSWVMYPSGERLLEYDTNGSIKANYIYSLSPNGIAELSLADNNLLYPSISNGLFTVKTKGGFNSLEVTDSYGKIIKSLSKTSEENVAVEIAGSGIYFVRVVNSDNSVKVKKVIVN
jgi:hypothetical protein